MEPTISKMDGVNFSLFNYLLPLRSIRGPAFSVLSFHVLSRGAVQSFTVRDFPHILSKTMFLSYICYPCLIIGISRYLFRQYCTLDVIDTLKCKCAQPATFHGLTKYVHFQISLNLELASARIQHFGLTVTLGINQAQF